jgi:Na+/proline symporter
MTVTLAATLSYLALQLGIGLWVARRVASESDYLVAGRRLGPWLATFSTMATWFGAETVVGSAGSAYRDGLSVASAEPFGYGLCLALMALIFAVPLWRRGLTTLADLFRARWSVGVERAAVVVLIPSSVLWAAAQVRALGTVLSTTAPTLDVEAGIAVAAGFVVLYTAVGGLLADAMNDLLQGLVLIVGLLVVGWAVLGAVGGPEGVPAALEAARQARAVATVAPSWLEVAETWAVPVFGSVIATELVARVIATRSPALARNSTLAAAALYLAVGLIPVGIGLVGASLLPGLGDAEQLVPALAQRHLGAVGFAVFAGGLVAAILSTVDSTLLVASGLLSHNVLVPALGVTDERRKVRIARLGVLAFGACAFLLAVRAEGVFALVEQASAFGSAGTLVCVCFALFGGAAFGGVRTAYATLAVGTLSYLLGQAAGVTAPFLLSLASALATYVAGGVLGRVRADDVVVERA